MAWGGGGWLIWRNGSLRNSASQPPSRRSAGSCEPWATANYRPDRVTMRKPRARSRILKKLPRAPGGNCAQEGACPRHDRNLVRRRGPHRPEEQDHPPLGQARHPPKRTAGPTDRFHLHLRCSLPEGGQGCSPDHAGLQHRGDELLAVIAANVAPAVPAILLVDAARWHLSTRLLVPANITIILLPPKCPEPNPVENVWQFMTTTGSPTASSNPTTISSTIVVRHGTSSSTSLGASCPSDF